MNAAPASDQTRWRRVREPLALAGGLSLATLALRLRDPHVSHSWGVCPLYAVTGVYCPGCGGLRAVNDLTRGEVGAALHSNVLIACGAPLIALLLAYAIVQGWRGRPVGLHLPRRAAWVLVAVAVVFTVVRNTPYGAALAPA